MIKKENVIVYLAASGAILAIPYFWLGQIDRAIFCMLFAILYLIVFNTFKDDS